MSDSEKKASTFHELCLNTIGGAANTIREEMLTNQLGTDIEAPGKQEGEEEGSKTSNSEEEDSYKKMIQKPSAQSKEVLWDIKVRGAKTLGDLIEPSALTDAGYAKEWKNPD